MSNRLEKIAEKKRREASEKQQRDVEQFARKVAEEVVGKLDGNKTEELKDTVAELATSVAQAVVASNKTFDSELKDSFTQLLNAVKNNKPDNSSLAKLNKEIGKSLAKFEGALDRLELSPEITVAGLTQDQLKTEIDKVLGRMPKSSQREVSLAYEKATADKYVNVRLTDGLKFYSAFSMGGGGGNGSPYIDSTGKIVNVELTAGGEIPVSATLASSPEYIKLAGSDANERDSTYYGDGLTSGVMAVHERYFDGSAYNRTPASKVLVDKATTNIIYIGKAPIGTALGTGAWQIKKIDKTVTDNVTITYAAAGAFTATWTNRGSETYS
jgi:hypothetical protein